MNFTILKINEINKQEMTNKFKGGEAYVITLENNKWFGTPL